MAEHALVALASLIVLGVGAQWLAWRLRIPAILLMLVVGFLAGPTSGLVDPDRLLGELLFPLVSLSVAVILFEGGLSLRVEHLREVGGVVGRLLTVGLLVTWALTTAAAWGVLRLPLSQALLLGAILVVTGPTVIGPMLREIRPTGRVGPIARWEGIVTDPVGAVLAVLVFEVVHETGGGSLSETAIQGAAGLLQTLLFGGIAGVAAALFLLAALRRRWIPDFLQSPVVLMVVLATFTLADATQKESGLLAVTVLGVVLANQRSFPVKHITEFKENLSVLLLAYLFILLSARLRLGDLTALGVRGLGFLAVLVLVVRPIAVLLSSIGTSLGWRERALLAWFAPRGIVAAAVSSLFAIRLGGGGQEIQSATFLVIVGTVLIYGFTAPWLARRLGLSMANPQGVLIAGSHAGARAIALALQAEGIAVMLVDTNRTNVQAARLEGLNAQYFNILSEQISDELDLGVIGRFLALTRNAEVNSLAALHFRELFGRAEVYQVRPESRGASRSETAAELLHGRLLFGPDVTYETLDAWFAQGAQVRRTRLTEQFDYQAFRAHHGASALPLFVVGEGGRLRVVTADAPCTALPNQTILSLVKPNGPDRDADKSQPNPAS